MEWHRDIWVHVQHMAVYRYQPELREKLVLPSNHRDLIDILTSKTNVFVQDFVPGKSGGTTILCQGAPGLGKTLTAEVYSEVVGKPLYRVHSGQLGTTAASVGAALSGILQRATRWDAILLLDEADVYIRRRDNDLEHNAIVAEFLRTLEYFNGLLFMTTNRIDDVDDAILSRCIAKIHYATPPRADAIRLWTLLAAQLGADLGGELIEALTNAWPQSSGRDIKELLKLTTRYCRAKEIPLSEDAFRICATFRGHA
jgi:AAA+ superfamily predicted ATPase